MASRAQRIAEAARQVLALTTGPVTACEVPSADFALHYRALPELRAALNEFERRAASPTGEGSNGDSPQRRKE